MSDAQAANNPNAIEVMGRKTFDAFLYDLYGCKEKNDVKADIDLDGNSIYRVEVFNSPEGLLIAAHELHRVHVIRPKPIQSRDEADFLENGETPAPMSEPSFVEMTPDDEANIRAA
ncbi:hypothetical protein [Neorhizobium alkalisoli]|uniref:hypothetical protein n=1 Tax=Neorhizobium alkalisoli TaxID=528178 RepID=UPI000CFA4581|nr:hypothetical protein [Neorhizobium alkalisoli]